MRVWYSVKDLDAGLKSADQQINSVMNLGG